MLPSEHFVESSLKYLGAGEFSDLYVSTYSSLSMMSLPEGQPRV